MTNVTSELPATTARSAVGANVTGDEIASRMVHTSFASGTDLVEPRSGLQAAQRPLPSGTGPGPDPAGAHRKSGKHRKPAEPSRLWTHVVTFGGVLHKASIVMALLAPLAVTR